MKIAQVAPLYESVPPKNYGGTERVVSYLTEELVKQGHEVTLFASGDSITSAKLEAGFPTSLRTNSNVVDSLAPHFLMLERVYQRAGEFDLIHFHLDYLNYPYSRRSTVATVTTLHGRLDIPELVPLYREFNDIPVISISDSQRAPLPMAKWIGTVYHGLPLNGLKPVEEHGEYFAFLGRISPEKRVDRAIELAKRTGRKLKIAAKVGDADKAYFEKEIKHLLDHPLIEFMGEIGGREKEEFLVHAAALIFCIDWPEPFGLVMIEAMSVGTPVIAYRKGSVPEVMDDGITGFIVDNLDQAVAAARRVETLDRKRIRDVFEKRFSATRMTRDYLRIYKQLTKQPASTQLEQFVA